MKIEDDKVDKISFKSILIFLGKFFLWGIIGTIFFWLSIIWDLSHYDDVSNDNKEIKIQPLSTRGLPPPETDIPVILPPDPGEAGKLTLEGIDSNNDGVRDDLEREIVYMYPQNEEVRRVLRAMVKKEQDITATVGDHEHFKELAIAYLSFWDCYDYLVFGSGISDDTNWHLLMSILRNTSERFEKNNKNNNIALPYSNPIYGTSQACTQPLVKGQY